MKTDTNMLSRQCRCQRLDAFTRLDLLALVAVLIVVTMLLAPAQSTMRMKSGLIVCLNNQKQLTAGWRMYAEDHDGRVFNMGDIDPFSWRLRPGTPQYELNPPPIHPVPTSALAAAMRYDQWGYQLGELFPYAPNHSIINCPDDARKSRNLPHYVSYSGMNDVGIGFPERRLNKVTEFLYPNQRYLWIEETDNRPMTYRGFIFLENLGSWALRSSSPPNPADGDTYGITTWWDGPAASHADGGTFGYADGHAYYRKWMNPDTVAFANNPPWGRATPGLTVTDDIWFAVRGYPSRLNP